MRTDSNPAQIKQNHVIPIALFFLLIGYSYISPGKSISLGPGIKAPNAPLQSPPTDIEPIAHDTYTIHALADFDCTAKIIRKKTYSDDWSDICPIDMTLGWEKMSDDHYTRYVTFDQRARWTYYQYGSLPANLSHEEISTQHSNVHMCPANSEVRSKLLSLPQGSVIHFKGKLIKLRHKESGWNATSSLTRTDSQAGACEIVWIEQLENKS